MVLFNCEVIIVNYNDFQLNVNINVSKNSIALLFSKHFIYYKVDNFLVFFYTYDDLAAKEIF